jgi:phosphatidylinositol 4-kinase
LIPLVRTAWWIDPALAIELATRFHYPRLHNEIRLLLLAMPEKAISEPEALPLIYGGQLPSDAGEQLKVRFICSLFGWPSTNARLSIFCSGAL